MSKTPTNIEAQRERIRLLKNSSTSSSASTPPSPSESSSLNESSPTSNDPSPTSEQPEHWRPQSDNMSVPPELIPQFMIETAKLFQLVLNLEIEAISAEAATSWEGNQDPRLPLAMEASRSMLILSFSLAQQIQEKYAAMIQQDQPQLWLPDTSLSTPIPVRNSDG